ncbi:MAG: hypothetical protein A2010_08900 [Nitrospirae bacterium GWD2_57_9]|nr:MAG: hypothetical protein A2010_08900 [Nitrospirae bacterium GWD2_57_9]OGW49254.1 MAG: hypothetical protein A2078_07735 [Nitrospirae bacterium GWC2_57_9]
MKRSTLMVITILFVFTAGTAFAAGSGKEEVQFNNGITFFDLGPKTTCEKEAAGTASATTAMSNGITAFEPAKTGAATRCAGGAAEPAAWPKNGITMFS